MDVGRDSGKVLWEYASGVMVVVGRDWANAPCEFGSCASVDKDCGIGF